MKVAKNIFKVTTNIFKATKNIFKVTKNIFAATPMSNIGGRKMSKSKSEESGYDSDTTRKSGTSSQVQY